jgi:hypothetical protein
MVRLLNHTFEYCGDATYSTLFWSPTLTITLRLLEPIRRLGYPNKETQKGQSNRGNTPALSIVVMLPK